MWLYFIKRIFLAAFTLLIILALSYTLLRLAPGNPAKSTLLASDNSMGTVNSEKGELAGNQAIREELNLDKPIIIGFSLWLKEILLHGNFGNSVSVDPGYSVSNLILERLPITFGLNLMALFICYIIAIPSGIFSAIKVNTFYDKSIAIFFFILYSLPGVWVALLLQTLFCEGGKYPIFPLKGIAVENSDTLGTFTILFQLGFNIILPVFCLAYAGMAGLSRYARTSMLEVLHQDYIQTARAKGVAEFDVIMHHGFRNGIISLITIFSGLLPSLIAGSVIIEYVFNIPGMGSLSMNALSSRDYPLQMALFAFAGSLTLLGIFISDMLYLWADPRISFNSKS